MLELSSEMWFAIVGGLLTWLIFALGAAQLSRFYSSFRQVSKDMDANLTGIGTIMRRNQALLTDVIQEQKRTNRLLLDLTELKRAEMTGDFDIVEEPIEPASSAAPETATAPRTTEPKKPSID